MSKVYLLDCTLRDGGYINDWHFGEEAIRGICQKIGQTGVDIIEVGFLKGKERNIDTTLFPDVQSIRDVIQPKNSKLKYVAMLDMSNPVPIDSIVPCDGSSIDGIRVIFKKDKMDEGFEYCKRIKELGYWLSVNFVSTDLYIDEDFIKALRRFNILAPDVVTIVDTFGLIKRKHFMRLAYLADNNLNDNIVLGYHAHNNMQQAFGNAEALTEMNLKRDVCIDACVFGMGRGAGNLNMELFAQFMNENYGTNYRIEPMLEIMDEYLDDIYRKKQWGYSLPLYLSAANHCHPNYAIYIAEKDTLNVKSLNEFFKSFSEDDKIKFSKDKAEKYYRQYQEHFVNDKSAVSSLAKEIEKHDILILAPGKSLTEYKKEIMNIAENKHTKVFAVNFIPEEFPVDYVFSSNIRRFGKFCNVDGIKFIITSNVNTDCPVAYRINYASYASDKDQIIDNSGLMLIKFLMAAGAKKINIAGMDGYVNDNSKNYYVGSLECDFEQYTVRNELISRELQKVNQLIDLNFVTPTLYKI